MVVEPRDGAGISRTLNRQHVLKCRQEFDAADNDDDDVLSATDSLDSDSDETLVLRRTTRTTAGRHSNPNKLPCAVHFS